MKNTRKYSKETAEFQEFFKSLKVLLRESEAEQGGRLTEVNAWLAQGLARDLEPKATE